MRDDEQRRAEAERRRSIQDQLRVETRLRTRGRGLFGDLGGSGGLTSLLGSG